ncbi:hypothetical protein [Georgenia sp. Z1491]|uniref:hypothetical protein n=1 Tax=Georgenia sp. Z1491 TaxID=3416707 RepID=UPI003CEFDBA1
MTVPHPSNPYASPPTGGHPAPRRPGWIVAASILVWVIAPWPLLYGLFATFIGGLGRMLDAGGSRVFGTPGPATETLIIGIACVAVSSLAIVLAALLWQGRNGARIGLTATALVAAVALVVRLPEAEGSPILGLALAVFVVVAMWLPASSRYIRMRRALRP